MALGDHYVVRLEVAVHDALAMCVGHTVHDVAQQAHRFGWREHPFARDAAAQRVPLDIRHDVEQHPVVRAGVEQRKDVRRLELRGNIDFAQEPLGAHRLREVGTEHLDRDGAAVLEVLGEVNRGHAAVAELALNGVAIGKGGPEKRNRIRHEWSR